MNSARKESQLRAPTQEQGPPEGGGSTERGHLLDLISNGFRIRAWEPRFELLSLRCLSFAGFGPAEWLVKVAVPHAMHRPAGTDVTHRRTLHSLLVHPCLEKPQLVARPQLLASLSGAARAEKLKRCVLYFRPPQKKHMPQNAERVGLRGAVMVKAFCHWLGSL